MEQTLLLRACLWSGEAGQQAWAAWCKCVGDPFELLRDGNERLKGLLPLIFASLRANEVVVEENLQTCLRTAYLREELRSKAYSRVLERVLSTYAKNQIPAILLKGAALSEMVYESPSLRHSGEIEILVENLDSLFTPSPMFPPGFQELNGEIHPELKEITLTHESGLPLHLYRSLFPISYYKLSFKDLWERGQIREIAGVPARILSPTDNLLHVCANAFSDKSRRSLLWVFDGWFIINKYTNLDWDELLETAQRSHLELPLSVTIGYLTEELNVPVPVSFLLRLYDAASKTNAEGRANALSVAREEVRGNYVRMFRMNGGWRARVYMANWIFCSPIDHVQWFRRNCHSRLLLSSYLSTLVNNLARRSRLLRKNRAGQ
jgi:hypothetical protein